MNLPKIEHQLNEYGMENVSCNNPLGIYKLVTRNDCHVKVYCDESDLDEVASQIKRHIDDVDYIAQVVDGTDVAYVIDGNTSDYFDSKEEALLYLLDPEEGLSSLHTGSGYKVSVSGRPDDLDKYNTDRTQYRCDSIKEIINVLNRQPYIHKLEGKFTEQEKIDLFKLSILIQQKLGKPSETRGVVL